jgi:hypothetical protein
MNDFILARRDDLEARTVDSELVLLDLRTQTYMSLNKTGAELWPLMVEGTERPALVEVLRTRHDITHEVAERDVDALVAQLADAGLLQAEHNDASPDPE